MTIQLTIIGLGQIGASIGLALGQNQDILRMGFDENGRVTKAAEKMGALDRINLNRSNAVKDADIVVVCTPTDQIRETLEDISEDLRRGALVLETGWGKVAATEWATTYLPEGCHYVGLTPIINACYLLDLEKGLEAAHADLFEDCWMGMVTPSRTSPEALLNAENLVRLLGASPYHIDALEVDGLVASVHILPQLIAAAYINTTQDQPGWIEGLKFSGQVYAGIGGLVNRSSNPNELTAAIMDNRENVSRMVQFLIMNLQKILDDISANDDRTLNEKLDKASSRVEAWWQQRNLNKGEEERLSVTELPSSRDTFRNLFGFRPGPKEKTKNEDKK